MALGRASAPLGSKVEPGVSPPPRREAGRRDGASDAEIAAGMEDTPALPPQATSLRRENYQCKRSSDRDAASTGRLFIETPSIWGGDLSGAAARFLWGEAGNKKEGRKKERSSQPNFHILLGFCSFSGSLKSQCECVGELVVCTQMKSSGRAFEILLKSKLPFHFNCSQEAERRARLTAPGFSLFTVRKLRRNIVAWENVLCGWWK